MQTSLFMYVMFYRTSYHKLCITVSSPDKDRDKTKEKYVKNTWKLHTLHNQYILAVKAAKLHQEHHFSLSLPNLHESMQILQEKMVSIL